MRGSGGLLAAPSWLARCTASQVRVEQTIPAVDNVAVLRPRPVQRIRSSGRAVSSVTTPSFEGSIPTLASV
jgi:hypothetical protein